MQIIELTLRTSCAIDAVTVIRDAARDFTIGMETIRTGRDVERSLAAGMVFLMSPGTDAALLQVPAGQLRLHVLV